MKKNIDSIVHEVEKVLLGKREQIQLALACIFSDGHLLIEDLPGMGKTSLAHALAKVLGLNYQRVQFTSDMLPADILGVSIFNPQTQAFQFHQGAIFTQILLADEINRSTPKTQSALLEAMEERQVTIEGKTYLLPQPFFVIATQNPFSQLGTYALPESQLDRFLMRISLGYPNAQAERQLFQQGDTREFVKNVSALLSAEKIVKIREAIRQVKMSDAVLDYLQRLVAFTRESSEISVGLSPRGALALVSAAKTWAFMQERAYLVPEDFQFLFFPVVGHRLVLKSANHFSAQELMAKKILSSVRVL